jgi:hypothetical protein
VSFLCLNDFFIFFFILYGSISSYENPLHYGGELEGQYIYILFSII